jgi:hypothetical protein
MTSPLHHTSSSVDANLMSELIYTNTPAIMDKDPGTTEDEARAHNLDRPKSAGTDITACIAKLASDRSLSAPPYCATGSSRCHDSDPGYLGEAGRSTATAIDISSDEFEEFVDYDPFYDTVRVNTI